MTALNEHTSIHDCLRGSLVDKDGRRAGEICDLLINRHTGRVDFVRVQVEPAEPAARRYISIPWSALRAPRDDSEPWSVQARRDTLRKMARFEVAQ